MIIPSKFLVKSITLRNEESTSMLSIQTNYYTRHIFFTLLKFSPSRKLMKVKEIKDNFFVQCYNGKMTMGLVEAKRIVDELTIEYDMNNIYRIRLVE